MEIKISVTAGTTINLGNYENYKYSATIDIPIQVKDTASTLEILKAINIKQNKINAYLFKKLDKIREEKSKEVKTNADFEGCSI